jgi:AraC-like DNA-binding protein
VNGQGRDRLRELLDAVLDTGLDTGHDAAAGPGVENADGHDGLSAMARRAFASPYHFSRQLSRQAGEPPVALRRRVMLERAAWQLARGATVTDAAFAAGYDSVDGFSRAFGRAFGRPPSATTAGSGHRLPAPNGIHFHPPTNLWVDAPGKERSGMELVAHLVHHDVDDTRALVELAASLSDDDYRKAGLPGLSVLCWDGPEESVAATLEHLVWTKEVWLAAINGEDFPTRGGDDPASLRQRHEAVAGRWVATVHAIEARDGWSDRMVDALCDPPESFVLGSVVAHVLTFSAHRRQLVRHLMRQMGVKVDHGDPIDWLSRRTGDLPAQPAQPAQPAEA